MRLASQPRLRQVGRPRECIKIPATGSSRPDARAVNYGTQIYQLGGLRVLRVGRDANEGRNDFSSVGLESPGRATSLVHAGAIETRIRQVAGHTM